MYEKDIDIVSHSQNGYKTCEIWLYVASSTLVPTGYIMFLSVSIFMNKLRSKTSLVELTVGLVLCIYQTTAESS